MVYHGLPINSMVIFHGELLNNQMVNSIYSRPRKPQMDWSCLASTQCSAPSRGHYIPGLFVHAGSQERHNRYNRCNMTADSSLIFAKWHQTANQVLKSVTNVDKKDLAISWPIDQLTNVSSGCGWSQPGGICTILILAGEPVMRSPFSRLRPEECQTKLKSSSKSVKLLSWRGGLWLKRWLSHVWNGNGMKCWNVGQDGWCTYKQMLRKRPWALFFSLRAPCLMNIA